MKRRNFLKFIGAGALASAIPAPLFASSLPDFSMVPASGHSGSGLRLSFEPYELKLRHSFNLASMSRTFTPDVLVKLSIDGVEGYGEASMPPYLGESVESVCSFLSRLDLGQFSDPFRMEEILGYVDSVAEGNNAAKAAVDIALHDLVGKIVGRPWHAIWGLSAEKVPPTSFTIGIDGEDVVRTKVKEADPYRVLKVKMGLQNDIQTVEVIRSMTSRPLCVDVNQGWRDKHHALDMCHWLAERGCMFVEQPLPKEMVDETAWLRERSPLPIVADEAVKRLADVPACKGVYDAINIKLMKSTGLREAHQMALLARALGMDVMIGCMTETSCAVSAACQLAPLARWVDLDGNLLITNDCFSGIPVVDGVHKLSSNPGIGVAPA